MLGIDIGKAAIKLAVMRRRRHGWRLQACAVQRQTDTVNGCDGPETVVLRETLKAALAKLPVRVRDAAVALDSAEAVTRVIKVDAGLSDQAIENRIAVEAEQHLPFALSEASLDFCRLPAPADFSAAGQAILLVACRQERLTRKVSLLTDLGIRPMVVDLDALALHRLAGTPAPRETQVILDLGGSGFRLHAFVDGRLLYSQSHQLAAAQTSDPILLTDSVTQRLVPEIRRAIQLFLISTAAEQAGRIILVGGLASAPGLATHIAAVCGWPVSLLSLPADITTHARVDAGQLRDLTPQLSLACALAMRVG